MMNRKRLDPFHLGMVAGIILLCAESTNAGNDRSNAAALGMAQAVVASSRGLESIGSNPSNLVLPLSGNTRAYIHRVVFHDTTVHYRNDRNIDTAATVPVSHDSLIVVRRSPRTLTLSLLPFSANVESNVLTADLYTEYFTRHASGSLPGQRFLTDADKTTILGLLSDNFVHVRLDAGVQLFGLSFFHDAIGAVALTVKDRASINVDVPGDYVRFALFGLDSLGSAYDFRGTNLRGWYLREYALSYARLLRNVLPGRDFSVGVSLKVVHGFACAITDRFEASFSNTAQRDSTTGLIRNYSLRGSVDVKMLRSTSETFSGNKFTLFPEPAGRGLGIDIGLSAQVAPAVRLAASIVDLGSIRWTANTRASVASGALDLSNPVSTEQTDRLADAINGVDTTSGEFVTPLATSVRVGGAVQIDRLAFMSWVPGRWLITFELRKDLNQLPGNLPHPRYAVGSEYRPFAWLPFRTGFSYTQSDRLRWSAGAGLDFGGFDIELGTENVQLFSSQGDYDLVSAALSMTIRL